MLLSCPLNLLGLILIHALQELYLTDPFSLLRLSCLHLLVKQYQLLFFIFKLSDKPSLALVHQAILLDNLCIKLLEFSFP
jgi:hypothetical protein